MDFVIFSEEALKTESKPERLRCNPQLFMVAMAMARYSAELLDLFKKAAFYGKPISEEKLNELLASVAVSGQIMDAALAHNMVNDVDADIGVQRNQDGTTVGHQDYEGYIRLAHSFVGCHTETAELLGALMDAIALRIPVDAVNISEEFGDVDWYKAIGFDELKLTEEASRQAVIAKLKRRYANKAGDFQYSDAAAINRDVSAERVVLEGIVSEGADK